MHEIGSDFTMMEPILPMRLIAVIMLAAANIRASRALRLAQSKRCTSRVRG